ncbi:hypothetical protein F0562_003901 [Nyssa sinensis]|uniref:Uncharacterized protein n=1 Tax=Nyssa sinensis TaxID=561372 RepID=A0A5J5BW23_9ASTE|nr:hypothetical protein F0562_003901 [Nyssa sinensis]
MVMGASDGWSCDGVGLWRCRLAVVAIEVRLGWCYGARCGVVRAEDGCCGGSVGDSGLCWAVGGDGAVAAIGCDGWWLVKSATEVMRLQVMGTATGGAAVGVGEEDGRCGRAMVVWLGFG